MEPTRQPVVTGPIDGARPPWGMPKVDLAERGYVVEEYQLSGETVAYASPEGRPPSWDGRWAFEDAGAAPYRTRILVIRPVAADRFNGTVVVNWQNVSAGVEGAAPSSGEVYEGYAWIGVSAQEVGIYGMPMGMQRRGMSRSQPLVDHDPERYGTLDHPGDQGAYEIFSQAGRAVGPTRDRTCDPLGGLAVERVIATGGSQSAMRLMTYFNGVHPVDRVYDGFVLTVWEGRAPHPEEGPVSFNSLRTVPRDDVPTPMIVVNSEFEAAATVALPLADHDHLRLWEVAGTPHAPSRGGESQPDSRGRVGNTLTYRPMYEAALRHLDRWLRDGTPPPAFPRIEVVDGSPPSLRRDSHGNAVGGIRLPELAAPTHEYQGVAMGTGRMPLFGSARPFADETVQALYGSRAEYEARWVAAVDELEARGAIRPEDAPALRQRVETVVLPVG